jgi:hypothetical protein
MFKGMLWALPISLLMWGGIVYGAVSLKDMLSPSPNAALYWPAPCQRNICVLTGLGGIVAVWRNHVDEHQGYTFIVKGVCASACEIVYWQVVDRGDTVYILPDAQLIEHAPTEVIWK